MGTRRNQYRDMVLVPGGVIMDKRPVEIGIAEDLYGIVRICHILKCSRVGSQST